MTGSRGRLLSVFMALAAAHLAFCLIVWGYGESPRVMLGLLAEGTWGSSYGVGQVLFKATPLLFAGIAVDVALRAGLFNVGAEGQIAVASLAAAWLGTRLPAATPAVVAAPLVLVCAMAAGAAWAAVPALLRSRFGAHEVLSTIVANRLSDSLVSALLAGGLALVGTTRTLEVVPGARLARLERFSSAFSGSAASVSIVLALLLAFGISLAFEKTRLRELVLVGQNPVACAAAGIPVKSRVAQALLLSGAIAGLASSATVLGYKGYYEMGLAAGAGFGGLAVAMLGRGSATGLVLAALLFGTLEQGGLSINAHVPREIMAVLEGVVIVAVALADARVRAALPALPRASGRARGAPA